VVADRLALYVDAVYNHPTQHVGSTLLLATIFFAFQIYCDFSAYSDIASGTSQILGIDLLRNFRRPYLADSIADFWSRWHISLSTWFRDYVYIPLGGNQKQGSGETKNIFTVFLVSGIWHGANWTFVLWGIWHGVFLLLQNVLARFAPGLTPSGRAGRAVRVALTFTIVVLSWVLFRANSVADAAHIYRAIFTQFDPARFFAGNLSQLVYGACGIGVLIVVEGFTESGAYPKLFLPRLKPVRWLAYAGIVILMLLVGVVDGGQFIYFQF
jgi:D-alanyl-lipoteichoic acid acyltransferase DltB (MBOAT superfamily)